MNVYIWKERRTGKGGIWKKQLGPVNKAQLREEIQWTKDVSLQGSVNNIHDHFFIIMTLLSCLKKPFIY